MKEEVDRLCVKCRYHELQTDCAYDFPCYWHGCRRESVKVLDPVTGSECYCPDKILECENERCQTKTIWERIFGERPGKCGRKGEYFSPKRAYGTNYEDRSPKGKNK